MIVIATMIVTAITANVPSKLAVSPALWLRRIDG
jgi:hypothetical protein